jgi:hypothetical protein
MRKLRTRLLGRWDIPVSAVLSDPIETLRLALRRGKVRLDLADDKDLGKPWRLRGTCEASCRTYIESAIELGEVTS